MTRNSHHCTQQTPYRLSRGENLPFQTPSCGLRQLT